MAVASGNTLEKTVNVFTPTFKRYYEDKMLLIIDQYRIPTYSNNSKYKLGYDFMLVKRMYESSIITIKEWWVIYIRFTRIM
jgi:hypothetical protein